MPTGQMVPFSRGHLYPLPTPGKPLGLSGTKSHRKIAVTTVAASGVATIPLQISGFSLRWPQKKRQPLAAFGVNFEIAGSSQQPRPQVAATARFRGRSDHGTLSFWVTSGNLSAKTAASIYTLQSLADASSPRKVFRSTPLQQRSVNFHTDLYCHC